ncbi:prolipoprotein diacylglyceryl transferase [Candidatus Peregrinibacteria bacterium]|nr:prolipoprotein diacylglyceryl transferase [Candidatus Peregrinibacteria bacterium]
MFPFPFTKITEIQIGFLSIKIWGLLVGIGMLAGLFIALKEAQRKGVKRELILDLFIWIFISSMIGGRLLYVVLFWKDFLDNPLSALALWDGGMVFYGGVLAALVALLLIIKKHGISFWKIADVAAPGLALGIFFGRIGCYLVGYHVGSKTSFFLASNYHGELRHEPALYDLFINGFVLFCILWYLRKYFKKEGMIAWFFIIWYAVARFFLDFFRNTDLPGALADPRFFGFTISQFISLIILCIFLPIGFRKFFYVSK